MIAGVKLSEDQMKKYCAGEAVYLKNMVKSDGSRFDACVQFSAVARKNEFYPSAMAQGGAGSREEGKGADCCRRSGRGSKEGQGT